MTRAGSKKSLHAAIFAATRGVRPPAARPRRGRPPIADPRSERSRKPWLAAGVSQRTWYRRKAAGALPTPPEPPRQHAAHVAAWYATLGAIARLEHRAFVRRCLLATTRGAR